MDHLFCHWTKYFDQPCRTSLWSPAPKDYCLSDQYLVSKDYFCF